MSKLKIVIVGGGSVAWTPALVRDMLMTPALSDAHYVLYDIDKKASDLTQAFLAQAAQHLGAKAKITSTDNRAAAFRGANYFIITISTGGLDAMAQDIAIPEKFGIYHTVGDTSGPGGWARLMRNFDVFAGLARDFNRYAPGAVVLNYTNPMTTLTDVLARLCTGPVVGLCHGLFENLRFFKDYYKLESEDQIAVQYGGLNHFFWITAATAGATDVMADVSDKLRTRGFTDLLRESHEDALGFKSNREVATELFRLTGAMPYLGDRHTCEFYPWYITSRKNMKKYKIVRTPIADRRKGLARRQEHLRQRIAKGIPEDFFKRSRETAADIIDAHSQGRVFIDVGNTPNSGQIANLPLGAVVETAVRVDRNGFVPITCGELPEVVRAMVEPYCAVFSMGVDACFEGDRRKALQALRLDPVCSHLNTDEVNELGERLLAAHEKFITAFN